MRMVFYVFVMVLVVMTRKKWLFDPKNATLIKGTTAIRSVRGPHNWIFTSLLQHETPKEHYYHPPPPTPLDGVLISRIGWVTTASPLKIRLCGES